MLSYSKNSRRKIVTSVMAVCVALVCAGCSVPAAPSQGAGKSGSDNSSNSGGNAADSTKEVCKLMLADVSNPSRSAGDIANTWDQIAKIAPDEIKSMASNLAKVYDKVASGDTGALKEIDPNDLGGVSTWMKDNCGYA